MTTFRILAIKFIVLSLLVGGGNPLKAQAPAQFSRHMTDAEAFFKQRDYARSIQSYQQALPLAHKFLALNINMWARLWGKLELSTE